MKLSNYLKIPLLLIALPYIMLGLYFIDSLIFNFTESILLIVIYFITLLFAILSLIILKIVKKKIDFSCFKNEDVYRWIGILSYVNIILGSMLFVGFILLFIWIVI